MSYIMIERDCSMCWKKWLVRKCEYDKWMVQKCVDCSRKANWIKSWRIKINKSRSLYQDRFMNFY